MRRKAKEKEGKREGRKVGRKEDGPVPEGSGRGQDLPPHRAGTQRLSQRRPGPSALTFEAGGAHGRHGRTGGLGKALEGRLLIGRLVRGGILLLLPLVVHSHGLQGQLLPAGTDPAGREPRDPRDPRDPPGPLPSPSRSSYSGTGSAGELRATAPWRRRARFWQAGLGC